MHCNLDQPLTLLLFSTFQFDFFSALAQRECQWFAVFDHQCGNFAMLQALRWPIEINLCYILSFGLEALGQPAACHSWCCGQGHIGEPTSQSATLLLLLFPYHRHFLLVSLPLKNSCSSSRLWARRTPSQGDTWACPAAAPPHCTERVLVGPAKKGLTSPCCYY